MRRLRLLAAFGLALLGLVLPLHAQQKDPSKKVALLVGVSQYQKKGFPDLKYAERDVQELAQVLRQSGFQVQLLLGSGKGEKRATGENLRRVLLGSFLEQVARLGKQVVRQAPRLVKARQQPNQVANLDTLSVLAHEEVKKLPPVKPPASTSANSNPQVKPSAPVKRPPRLKAPFTAQEALEAQKRWAEHLGSPVVKTNTIGMKLVLIPPGEFQMGSTREDVDQVFKEWKKAYPKAVRDFWIEDELPQHPVRITRPFYLGAYEVTVGQFRKFVQETGYRTEAETDGKGGWGYNAQEDKLEQSPKYTWRNPGFRQTDDHPVVNVSWNDAQAFCRWLSRKEGVTYRLPTEAQWEYACRAGTTTWWYHGNNAEGLAQVANVADQAAKQKFSNRTTISANDGFVFTAPVGQFRANGFGLYDMHGNVWEWCEDWYDAKFYSRSPLEDPVNNHHQGKYRVLRGGSWYSHPLSTRSANREGGVPEYRLNNIGFRVARAVE